MTKPNDSNTRNMVTENADISTTANAEAKNKTGIWADSINTDTLIALEGMMGNFKTWNSNFRNELLKKDCLDVIKYQIDEDDKMSVIADKNVATL